MDEVWIMTENELIIYLFLSQNEYLSPQKNWA